MSNSIGTKEKEKENKLHTKKQIIPHNNIISQVLLFRCSSGESTKTHVPIKIPTERTTKHWDSHTENNVSV